MKRGVVGKKKEEKFGDRDLPKGKPRTIKESKEAKYLWLTAAHFPSITTTIHPHVLPQTSPTTPPMVYSEH